MKLLSCLVAVALVIAPLAACGSSTTGSGGQSSGGGAVLGPVCSAGQTGGSCACLWQPPPAQGTSYVPGCGPDQGGGCCASDGWKTTENASCGCQPAQKINCWGSQATAICECVPSDATMPPAPGYSGITSCDPSYVMAFASVAGHCCKASGDAGAAASCTCSINACKPSEVEVQQCMSSSSPIPATCPAGSTAVANCEP